MITDYHAFTFKKGYVNAVSFCCSPQGASTREVLVAVLEIAHFLVSLLTFALTPCLSFAVSNQLIDPFFHKQCPKRKKIRFLVSKTSAHTDSSFPYITLLSNFLNPLFMFDQVQFVKTLDQN